ncbi:hypothetical protein FQN60_001587, partial [Etheostoma spectabile]
EAPGPCRGLLTRYFFDSDSQQCKHFYYGGCFGNANNFKSMAACQAKCQNPGELTVKEAQVQANGTNGEPRDFKPTELCFSPVERGPCDGAEKRFAYNPKTKRCLMFQYSGCGGNDNNFTHRKDCFHKCIRGR